MKTKFTGYYLAALTAALSGALPAYAAPALVKITNNSGEKIYFQPEGERNYTEVTDPFAQISVHATPAYYRLMDGNGQFYTVFLTDGSITDIKVTRDGVAITGDNERENAFIRDNVYICRTPSSIKSYSPEWVEYNDKAIARLDSMLDTAGLNPEFVDTHKLYHRYIYFNQRLGGVAIAKVFNVNGEKTETDSHFYDFLDSLTFDSPRILLMPKWFDVMSNALEMQERRGKLQVSNDAYLTVWANAIPEPTVRSRFLVKALDRVLKYSYLNDFASQLPAIEQYISGAEDLAALEELKKVYEAKVTENTSISRGTPMPAMTFNDLDGKKYSLDDFKGKYVLIDFWFTGCAPCRAEMPYFDQVAKDFNGKNIRFISLSVDTGAELYAAWEKMMRENPHPEEVLCVNLPQGFNSPILKQLNIHGVPRIMLIDPEGRIVESHAKRPSDPKLRQQLETLSK